MAEKKPKKQPRSGKVEIMLGPKEVEEILATRVRFRTYGKRPGSDLDAKLYEAVAAKFAVVATEYEDLKQASEIQGNFMNSPQRKALREKYATEMNKVWAMRDELDKYYSDIEKGMLQSELNAAGVKKYVATGGISIMSLEEIERRRVQHEAWLKQEAEYKAKDEAKRLTESAQETGKPILDASAMITEIPSH